MEDIKKLLKPPFDDLKEYCIQNYQEECSEIAKELFCNWCINCNGKEYYLAEIEFYYYDSKLYLHDKKQFKWQKVTYARDGYNAGDLLYHLSGIDICFESSYNNQEAKFGGILIRAIKEVNDKNGTIIAGPLVCKDEILNACKGGNMPLFCEATKKRKLTPKATYRALGKVDIDKDNDRLCFYDSSKNNNWNPTIDKYDKEKGIIKPCRSSYKTDRFHEKN